MKNLIPLLLLLCSCGQTTVTTEPITEQVTFDQNDSALNVVAASSAAAIKPVEDGPWFPANPYCGKTGADFPLPFPLPCQPGYQVMLNRQCALDCAETYREGMLSIYEIGCIQYERYMEYFRSNWDHHAEELRMELLNCMGDQQCIEDTWELFDSVMMSLINGTQARIDALDGLLDLLAAQRRQEYLDCLLQCCEPIINEPKPIR